MKAIGRRFVGGTDRPAGERDLASVGVVDARQDLDQRRLAGAVLPEQRVNLAAANVEVDMIERERRGEALDEAGHDEQRLDRRPEKVRSAAVHAECYPSR